MTKMYEKHKCFISFKMEDEEQKNKISEMLGKDYFVDKSLKEPINSEDSDYIMRRIREKYLSDSTVTIFLIGKKSSENLGSTEQEFIKRELQASLYNGENNTRSGILGVVLPEMYDRIYQGKSPCKCEKCGDYHNIVCINDNTVIREFSANYYVKGANKVCNAWREDERFCVLAKWDDFMKEPDKFIDMAFRKRQEKIAELVVVHP